MKRKLLQLIPIFCVLSMALAIVIPKAVGQTPLGLSLEMNAGQAQLTVTGSGNAVGQIQWTDNLSSTGRWYHLEHSSVGGPPLADPGYDSASGRYYRAVWTPSTGMVWIPPGTFLMGSPTNEQDRSNIEGPQTLVHLTHGFWMGKNEVTQGEFLDVMGLISRRGISLKNGPCGW